MSTRWIYQLNMAIINSVTTFPMTDSFLPMTRPLRWLETQSGPKCYNCVTAMQSIISTDFLFPS